MKTNRLIQMNTLLLLLVVLFPLPALAQIQIGDDLIGEFVNDLFGSSVALSADGSRLVVGSITNSEAAPNSGQVQVFENVNGTWVQLGQDINGSLDARLGRGVAISGDGSIIALGGDGFDSSTGKVRVFEFSSGSWIQLGQELLGSATESVFFGNEVCLSSDGSILAVGAPGGPLGSVRVFQNQGGTWGQLGDVINGDVDQGSFGNGLALSANGLRVAIGGDGSFGPGRLRVFDFVADNWTQAGQTIVGMDNDRIGGNVALSDDGTIMAVSALGNDDLGAFAGAARVYRDNEGTWTQIGDDLLGTLLKVFGASLSLSSDGSVLTVGAAGNGMPGTVDKDGNIIPPEGPSQKIFINEDDSWVELANIEGELDSFFGLQSHISKDGLTLAVGAQSFDGSGFNRGLVRAFDLADLVGCPFSLGDLDEDGFVTLLDVGPFVDALTNGGEQVCQADINGDGVVDLLDVGPFVDLLLGG